MIHSASIRHHPLRTRHPCNKPGELHMGPGLCKWPNLVCAVNSILQALAQLDFVQLNPPAQSNLSSANLGLQSSVAAFVGDLSLTKSKQFVSIKKCLSQVLQWNRNAWWAPPGPRPTEKFEVVLPFINDGCKHHYMVSQGNWIVKSLNSQG